MSGSAAGDVLMVVSTRLVSWAVFMATSPPLGSIQWNRRFIIENAKWKMKTIVRTGGGPLSFRWPDQGQDFPAKDFHFINLRPAGDDELANADLLVFEKGVGKLRRRTQ